VKKPDWTWYATGPGNGIQLRSGRVIAGYEQTAASQLDSVSGPGGVPGPVRLLDVFGDLLRFRPRCPIVAAASNPNGPFANGIFNLAFIDLAWISSHQ